MDAAENALPGLSGVAETLLVPLYVRALESQRPDALLRDETAVALVRQMGDPAALIEQAGVSPVVRLGLVLRHREFDRRARDYLARCPQAVVVHIGCGLDARFERVDDGGVEWYDLDLPEVIALRRKLIGPEAERYHLLACSVLEDAWLEALGAHRPRPFLFLAEGLFMFLAEAQVRSLVLRLRQAFPGAELVFDAFSPLFVWANNLRLARTGVGARCRWALKRGQDLERWGEGVHLLDEWFPFASPEPRLAPIRWVRRVPLLARVTGVFHYQLGKRPIED